MYSNDTLVLQVIWGGLGDHLFFSHIPRIAKETGAFKKVLISTLSDYKSPLYKSLVWDLNPFIDGFVESPGWYPEIPDVVSGCNLLDMVMLGYGLDDGCRGHEPEVYFKPNLNLSLKNKTIYDPNYIANAGRINESSVNNYFRKKNIHVDFQLKPFNNSILLKNVPYIQTASLEDYCSLILSCKDFYCLTSGGATLAAALHKRAHVLYGERVKRKFHHSAYHDYIFIKQQRASIFFKVYKKFKYILDKH